MLHTLPYSSVCHGPSFKITTCENFQRWKMKLYRRTVIVQLTEWAIYDKDPRLTTRKMMYGKWSPDVSCVSYRCTLTVKEHCKLLDIDIVTGGRPMMSHDIIYRPSVMTSRTFDRLYIGFYWPILIFYVANCIWICLDSI